MDTILSALITALAMVSVGILTAITTARQHSTPPSKATRVAQRSLDIIDALHTQIEKQASQLATRDRVIRDLRRQLAEQETALPPVPPKPKRAPRKKPLPP